MTTRTQHPILKAISIFTLYIIYLFDIASIVIVLVLFSTLLIDPTSQMVAPQTSIHTRNLLLGLLYAAFPLTQFLGAPILGELSDRIGRKVILNVSTLGTVAAFFLTALSILENHLLLLFLSRLIGGFFAGNASLAQAGVSNLVSKKNRSFAMALFAVAGGCSWIVGPFIGTIFSDSSWVSWFGLDTPFWLLGLIFLACWGLIMLSYQCLHVKGNTYKISISGCFKNLVSIFDHRIIVIPFISSLVSMFGWMIVQDFFSPFLMEKFSFTKQQVGYSFAYMSLWWLVGGILATVIFKFKRPSPFIATLMTISGFAVIIYSVDPTYNFIYWAVALANVCYAFSYSGFAALFAHLLPDDTHGRLYGSWTGGFALMSTFAPAFAGWISRFGIGIPFLSASAVLLLAAGIYFIWRKNNTREIDECNV